METFLRISCIPTLDAQEGQGLIGCVSKCRGPGVAAMRTCLTEEQVPGHVMHQLQALDSITTFVLRLFPIGCSQPVTEGN